MKIHRFFLNNPLGEELEIKEKGFLHQWNNVLKFKIGEDLILFNSQQPVDYIYKIKELKKNIAKLILVDKRENLIQEKEGRKVNLCISLIKKDNLDLILEKCTEIGVLEFTPIVTERVEKKNIASFNKERGEKTIIEAVEQTGWGTIPKLYTPTKIENLLKELENKNELENIAILDIDENNKEEKNFKSNEKTYILIGPEGGWTENERNLFRKYKLKPISFGKNTLRAETAALIASFVFFK